MGSAAIAAGRRCGVVAAASLALLVSPGCSSSQHANGGDCNARVSFDGRIYDPPAGQLRHGFVRTPRSTGRLGQASLLGCSDEAVGHQVSASGIAGVDPAAAIFSYSGGVYVARGLVETPRVLQDALVPVPCVRATRFTGTWDDISNQGDRGGEAAYLPPYTATFTTDNGAGLPLRQWARIRIAARVTADTKPAPPSLQVGRMALGTGRKVTVTVHCAGDKFEVDRLTLA